MQRLKGERGIACAVAKRAGGSERKPQLRACSRLPEAALPQRPCSSGPAACCCADVGGAVLPRFRRHRQPLELGHYQRRAYGCATSSILVHGFLSGDGDTKCVTTIP